MTANGLSVATFMEAYFASSNHRIKSRVGWFFKHMGFTRIFQAMARSSKFTANRRATSSATTEIADIIKDDILRLVLQVLRQELRAVAKDPRSRVDPEKITPIDCADFSFKDIQKLYEEKSPILWKVICILGGMTELLDPEDTINEDDVDPQSEVEDIDSEPDLPPNADGRNDLFDPPEEEQEDEDSIDMDELEKDNPFGSDIDRSLWVTESELEEAVVKPYRQRSFRRRHISRDRPLMATCIMSVLLYSRSRWNNTMQTMLGVWANAVHIPKRAVNTMNRCGFIVSYDTIRKGLRAVARYDRKMLQTKIEDGRPFGIFWDNLVRSVRKGEETITNRRSLEQNTSAFVHFLQIPEPVEGSSLQMMQTYHNIIASIEESRGLGLTRSLLYLPLDQIENLHLDKRDFLFDKALGVHIRLIASVRIGEVFKKIFGIQLLKNDRSDGKVLELPQLPISDDYPRMKPDRSDLHCLPTMGLDETTIDGTAMVLEEILQYCGVEQAQLLNRSVLASGDQMSNARMRKLKELRVRDDILERYEWAIPKPGPLHISMAYLQGFLKVHMMGKSGKDPTSLVRFAATLARSRLSEDGKIIDFNAANRFVTQAWEAHVLAAAVAQSGVMSLDELEQWLKTNDWTKLIDDIVRIYFPTEKVTYQREIAQKKARDEYLEIRQKVLKIAPAERTLSQRDFLGWYLSGSASYLLANVIVQERRLVPPLSGRTR